LLGVVWECPVLLFDALSITSGKPNGDYYAGKGGIDQSLLYQLGLDTTSFFSVDHPEETMMIFNDQYMPMEYHQNFAQHGWKPSRMKVKMHDMTHWYVIIAR